MYYILEYDRSVRKVRHLEYTGDEGWGLDFLKGRIVSPVPTENDLFVKFECPQLELPDYFEVSCVPIVKENFIHLLKKLKIDNFQAFPVDVHFSNGKTSGYYLINIVGRLTCIDKDATDGKKRGPVISRVFDLKIDETKINDVRIFRDHAYQELVFIYDELKEAIEQAGISGCSIRPADGWNDSHRF